MRINSDSKVSDFLNDITVDQRITFLNEWNRHRDHREKIYIYHMTVQTKEHACFIEKQKLL